LFRMTTNCTTTADRNHLITVGAMPMLKKV
jgi:hypothetical protein